MTTATMTGTRQVDIAEWDSCGDCDSPQDWKQQKYWAGLAVNISSGAVVFALACSRDDEYLLVVKSWHSETEAYGAILALCKDFHIGDVAYDHWNTSTLTRRLEQAGIPLVGFPLSYRTYAEPARLLIDTLLPAKRLYHNDSPVLRQAMSDVVFTVDSVGNMKPSMAHSTGPITGALAAIMALARAHVNKETD